MFVRAFRCNYRAQGGETVTKWMTRITSNTGENANVRVIVKWRMKMNSDPKGNGTEQKFRAFRKGLLRKFRKAPGSFTATCKFPNNDVPQFLKRLDEFERRSAKTSLLVKGNLS